MRRTFLVAQCVVLHVRCAQPSHVPRESLNTPNFHQELCAYKRGRRMKTSSERFENPGWLIGYSCGSLQPLMEKESQVRHFRTFSFNRYHTFGHNGVLCCLCSWTSAPAPHVHVAHHSTLHTVLHVHLSQCVLWAVGHAPLSGDSVPNVVVLHVSGRRFTKGVHHVSGSFSRRSIQYEFISVKYRHMGME